MADASAGLSASQATVERSPPTVAGERSILICRSSCRGATTILEALMRIDEPAVYNPFGWRVAEIADTATDDTRRQELAESLVICEAEELALGRRHVTIVHGDPDCLSDSRHLTEFYDTIAGLASGADWTRVRGTSDYVTATFAGPNAEQMISLVVTAAGRANPGWWKVTESPYPDVT